MANLLLSAAMHTIALDKALFFIRKKLIYLLFLNKNMGTH